MKKYILILLAFLLRFNSYSQNGGGGVIVYDTEAREIIRIIENERISGGGSAFTINERLYVNYIVTNFKAIGVWNKITALYGFVGGTAASHKWNWKDMRNLDAAYRLVSVGTGGVTHNANGVTATLTSALNTFYNTVNFIAGDMHMSNYVSIDNSSTDVAMGYQDPINNNTINMISRTNGLRQVSLKGSSNGVRQDFSSISNNKGYHISSISTNTISYHFKSIKETFTSSTSATLVNNGNIYLCGRNQPSLLGSSKTYSFFSFGSGLTDTEAIRMSNIVTFAQSILNRQ